MSTAILVAIFALIGCVVLSGLALTGALLVSLWRWARRTDTYEPAAAEVPIADPVERHYASVGDTFGFGPATEAFDEVFNVLGPPPGWKSAPLPSIDEEITALVARYRAGEDIESGAPRERL